MQVIGGLTYNPGNGNGTFSAGVATQGGVVILHNLSPYDVLLTFNNDPTRQGLLHAWQPRKFDFCGVQTLTIGYSVQNAPSQSIINASPSSYIWGESFSVGETIPESLPNYDRLSNLGNSAVVNTPSNVIEQDILTPFAFSGLALTHSINVNQADVQPGIVLLRQSDNSLLHLAPVQQSFLTSAANSVYYLDINPDGTYSWGTTHSTQTNYMSIWQVNTDASGNISTTTDLRNFIPSFLYGQFGGVQFYGFIKIHGQPDGKGSDPEIGYYSTTRATQIWTPQTGASQWIEFVTWNGSAVKVPFGIGSASSGNAAAYVDDSGNVVSSTLTLNGPATSSYIQPNIPSTTADINGVIDILDLTTGSTRWQVGKQSHANGDYFRVIDSSMGVEALKVYPNGAGISTPGSIKSLGGQSTAGIFGSPVIISTAPASHVTSTSNWTLIVKTIPATGLYRASITFNMGGTSPSSISAWISYFSGVNSGQSVQQFFTTGSQFLNGASVTTGEYGTLSIAFYAANGTTFNLSYKNGTATPNDFVVGVLERLM